jgi:hypothetical protein
MARRRFRAGSLGIEGDRGLAEIGATLCNVKSTARIGARPKFILRMASPKSAGLVCGVKTPRRDFPAVFHGVRGVAEIGEGRCTVQTGSAETSGGRFTVEMGSPKSACAVSA